MYASPAFELFSGAPMRRSAYASPFRAPTETEAPNCPAPPEAGALIVTGGYRFPDPEVNSLPLKKWTRPVFDEYTGSPTRTSGYASESIFPTEKDRPNRPDAFVIGRSV